MSRKTEIQVGVTVLVAIAILLWGIAWLSTLAKAHVQRTWHVSFPQGGGLAEGNEAQVNGVRKGVVTSLRLVGDHVVVDLALAKDVELTRDSRVVIRSVSMMGDKVIAVDYSGTGEPWSPRDTIPGVYEKGLPEVMADVGRASGSVAAIARQLDSLAVAMNQGGGLTASIENFRRTSRELELAVAENRAALRTTMANFSATSTSAKELVVDHQESLAGGARPLRLGGREPGPGLGQARFAARLAAGRGVAAGPRRGHARQAREGRAALRGPRGLGARPARADRGPQGESAEVLQVLGVLMPKATKAAKTGEVPLLLQRVRQRGGALVRALPLVRGVEHGGRGAGRRGGRERGRGPRRARALGAEVGGRAARPGRVRGRSPTSRSRPRTAGPRACASSTACWAAA